LSANIEPARAIVQPSEQNHSADIRTALWLGLALFFFYLLTTSGHLPYADEADYVNLAHNILTRGRLIIEQVELGPDGRPQHVLTYSRLPLGQSLLTLPFVFLALTTRELLPQALSFAAHLVINWLPAAESAATCALVFLLIRILGRSQPELYLSRRTSMAVAFTTALGTQMWPASRTLFADTSAALLLTFTIYSLVRVRHMDGGARWILAAAWSAALAVLCKTTFILAVPALAAYGIFAVVNKERTI
jgi:4-amino-4-deoxy-L-arabinose transferase-like glycosyltransferase